MEQKAYFISDAHLGVTPSGAIALRESALIQFLNKINASHLVIVGDLFEFWYEYSDYVCKNHFELFFAFKKIVESGTEVHLLKGNHDFAYEDFFPKNLGINVHSELTLNIQGKRVYFRHGDGVAKSDFGYRLLRKILDFKLNRFLFKQIHPDYGMALARFVGKNSRKAGQSKVIKMDEYEQWANAKLKEKNCDICILGHHHIPGIWNVKNGIVASAGNWLEKLTYIRMEKGELHLEDFSSSLK